MRDAPILHKTNIVGRSVHEKEKIAVQIEGKIASVKRPSEDKHYQLTRRSLFFRSEKGLKCNSMASKSNIDHYKKCLQICAANRDPLGIANNSNRIGDAYVSSGKYERAIEYYEKSLQI